MTSKLNWTPGSKIIRHELAVAPENWTKISAPIQFGHHRRVPATIQSVNYLTEIAMQDTQLNRISNFIWSVADDVLRDLYVRGKYRDVILPMTVLRRLDAVLEPTKQKVLEEKKWLDEVGITDLGQRSSTNV